MATREIPCAASSLLCDLVAGAPTALAEVARTRLSVHYETGDADVPVLSVCTPEAVRLPNTVVTGVLPAPGPAWLGGHELRAAETSWRVRRWWRPSRPGPLPVPALRPATPLPAPEVATLSEVPVPPASYDGLQPDQLVGAGPGLTPAGDDVLAGALVTAYATSDPRLVRWRQETRAALTARRTTAVSRALLHHALDGYSTADLADLLTALCRGADLAEPRTRLLAVGHTSGAALLVGVLHTLGTRSRPAGPLTTHRLEGAA